MLRRTLIAASESATLRRAAEGMAVSRAVARRFVAGDTLDDALRAARRLSDAGMLVSLDHLGESVDDPSLAERAAAAYHAAVDRLADAGHDIDVSVKLSQLGLGVDRALCRRLVADVCAHARGCGGTVTIDMEGSDRTDATVELVLALRADGHDNVGCAVQSYLHRTPDDVERLVAAGASLRLCKGAYAEPPHLAHQSDAAVDRAYATLADRLLRDAPYPRIATHDHRLVRHVKQLVRRHRRSRDDFEFQMLYGVREPLQRQLVAEGWRLRIYVPYGTEWYPYFVRRIAERPANLTFFLRAVTGRR